MEITETNSFPNTFATPSEEDAQKMCKEGGANLVRFLITKPSQPASLNMRASTIGPIRTLLPYPKLSRNSGDLLAKKSLMCCKSARFLSWLTIPETGRSLRIDVSLM